MPRRRAHEEGGGSSTSPKRSRRHGEQPSSSRPYYRPWWLGHSENTSGRRTWYDPSSYFSWYPALNETYTEEEDETPLKPTHLDLNLEVNRSRHRTSEYEVEDLILRRGQEFFINVTFDREVDVKDDQIILQFIFGAKPMASKGTLLRIPVEVGMKRDKEKWQADFSNPSHKTNKLDIRVYPPADAIVGRYHLYVITNPKEDTEYKRRFEEPIYVLFNPWCREDQVYLENDAERREYVMTDHGSIWTNYHSRRGRPWYFGQFDDAVFEAAHYLLSISELPDAGLANATQVSRVISAMANSNDRDGGVLTGRWTQTYPKDSTSPLAWTGSVKILEQFMKTKKDVRYGQCWVFSGIVTSLLRSLGIPTRSVTNFDSAHDSDNSMTIDFHYDTNGDPLSDLNDSIWNFHVWNESWFKRPDLPEGYDGWQAHDATPQESSGGVMRCGPASVKAIKTGHVYLPYDSSFVFGEVNGDKVYWQVDKKGELTCLGKDTRTVGRATMTKAVGSFEGNNITRQYKFEEGSAEERRAVRFACRFGSKKDEDIYVQPKRDVEFTVKGPEEPELGKDFSVKIHAKNLTHHSREVTVVMSSVVSYYTGVPAEKVGRKVFEETIPSHGEKDLVFTVHTKDYIDVVKPEGAFQVFARASVKENKQTFAKVLKFSMKKPDLDLSHPDKVKLNHKFDLVIKFTNPLDKELTNCYFTVESRGMARGAVTTRGKVKPHEEVTQTVHLTPRRKGDKSIIATFTSDQLSDVTGMSFLHVEEK